MRKNKALHMVDYVSSYLENKNSGALYLKNMDDDCFDISRVPGNGVKEKIFHQNKLIKSDNWFNRLTSSGQYSIRINDQWRICFCWDANDAYEVAIVDYH